MKELGSNCQSGVSQTSYSNPVKLVLGSIFTAFAVIFQSAGIFVGFGYAFSILATLPIVLSSMLSIRIGFMSYFITILLLIIIQPSEVIVFSFTTGFLGICLGMAFKRWGSWLAITLFGGGGLTAGIVVLLYVLQFPILGPSISKTFDFRITLIIFLFSLFYSMVWVGLSKKIYKTIIKKYRSPSGL